MPAPKKKNHAKIKRQINTIELVSGSSGKISKGILLLWIISHRKSEWLGNLLLIQKEHRLRRLSRKSMLCCGQTRMSTLRSRGNFWINRGFYDPLGGPQGKCTVGYSSGILILQLIWIGFLLESLSSIPINRFIACQITCKIETISKNSGVFQMAKTQRKLKKANHGKRPASSKARKAKRKHFRFSWFIMD